MALTKKQEGWLNGKPLYYEYGTGAAALAETIAPGRPFELLRIEIHLNAVATQDTFTVTLDAGRVASVYDTLILSHAMVGVTDIIATFGEGHTYMSDDEIDFAFTNTDTKTYGLTVVYRGV